MGLGLPNHSLTGRSLQKSGGAWITKPFTNWKISSEERISGLVGLGLPNHSLTGRSLQRTGGAWITKPFTNWKISSEVWLGLGISSEVWLGLGYQTIH